MIKIIKREWKGNLKKEIKGETKVRLARSFVAIRMRIRKCRLRLVMVDVKLLGIFPHKLRHKLTRTRYNGLIFRNVNQFGLKKN